MKKKILILLTTLIFIISGCAKKEGEREVAYYNDYSPKDYDVISSTSNNLSVIKDEIKKIIVSSAIHLETYNIDETVESIKKEIIRLDGYIQSSREYVAGNYRYANITVRIPSDKYNEFIESSKKSGNVTDISTSTNDITDTYYNIAAELESLKLEEERVKEFYSKAENITELLTIEKRLSEIQTMIAQDEVTLKNYDLLTSYSTIEFTINEVKSFTENNKTFIQELKEEFIESFMDFTDFLKNTIFTLIHLFWYILIIGIIALLCRRYKVFKKITFKRRKNNKNEEIKEVNNKTDI